MHQFKRFQFWEEKLVTQPAAELREKLGNDKLDAVSTSEETKNSQSIRRALAKSRKHEAHKGIQALQIICAASGVGFLVFGGADGRITVADQNFRLLSTRAYTKRVTHMQAIPQHGIIVTVGDGLDPRPYDSREVSSRISRLVRSRDDWSYENEDSKTTYARRDYSASIDDDSSPCAVMKVWRVVNSGGPREMSFPMECVDSFPVFSQALPEQMITSMSVMDNLSQIAVGLANGAVMVLMPDQGHKTLVAPGMEPRRRILLPADPRGYRVTNLAYSYDNTILADDHANVTNSNSTGPVAGVPYPPRPSVDKSRAHVAAGVGNRSSTVFQELKNVTLFVTTGLGRNRTVADAAPSSSGRPSDGNSRDMENEQKQGVRLVEDGGHLVSFENVELARNEELQVPGVLLHEQGCNEGCCVVNGDGYAVMARTQGLFLYSADGPGPCYSADAPKTILHWHGNYVLLVTDQSVVQRLSIYDVRNKINAFTKNFRVVDVSGKRAKAAKNALNEGDPTRRPSQTTASVMRMHANASSVTAATEDAMLLRSDGEALFVLEEWGKLFIITSTHRVYSLSEKDTQTKIKELERKHLYHIALSLAVNDIEHDVDSIFEICKNYGDHLYDKGEYDDAVQQYIHCGLNVEPSHVIRKFLEANRLKNLTEYLEALHHRNMQATTDHTTLLLTCYTQQQNVKRLRAFIGYQDDNCAEDQDSTVGRDNTPSSDDASSKDVHSDGHQNFDVPTAIRVLHRRHFTDEASFLARKHKKHDDYIRIQLENINPQRARSALVYISGLSFLDAEAALKVNGKILLQYLPEETTEILKSICTPSAHNSSSPTRNGLSADDRDSASEFVMSSQVRASLSNHKDSEGAKSSSGSKIMLVSDPEEFIATFVDHPLHLKQFLWHIVGSRRNTYGRVQTKNSASTAAAAFKAGDDGTLVRASTLVWNTLLELCLNRDIAIKEIQYQRRLATESKAVGGDDEDGDPSLNGNDVGDPHLREILHMASGPPSKEMPNVANLDAAADALVEDEVMSLLKDSASRYDADHALVLVQQYHFEPGMMYLYEKRKMYHMLVQRHMDSGNHHAILATCRKYGQRDPNLWVQVLTYLAESYGAPRLTKGSSLPAKSGASRATANNPQICARYIQQVLQLGSAFLPPLLVLSILSKNKAIPLSIVHEYLVKHLRSEQQAIQDDADDIIESTSQIESIRTQMHVLETCARVFNHSTDQLIPDQPLNLPVIHFMSGNSYNLENVDVTHDALDSSGKFRHLDPNMAKQEHLLTQMQTDLRHKSQKHEDFYREMQAAGRGEAGIGGFDKVAEYFGLGVFDHAAGKNQQMRSQRNESPRHIKHSKTSLAR